HTRSTRDWSSDVCSSDLDRTGAPAEFQSLLRLPTPRRTEVRPPLRKRGAGFIPQERGDRTDAPAKFQSLLRLPTPLRTEVRAPAERYTPLARSRCHGNRSCSSRRRALLHCHSRGASTNFAFVGFCST